MVGFRPHHLIKNLKTLEIFQKFVAFVINFPFKLEKFEQFYEICREVG